MMPTPPTPIPDGLAISKPSCMGYT